MPRIFCPNQTDLTTTTTTSTVSPYVQEIYRPKHHRSHHSKFKKKHHKPKYHPEYYHRLPHWRSPTTSDEGRVYTHPRDQQTPSLRTNYPGGRVNFYDRSNRLDGGGGTELSWRHLGARDKWPFFTQVKNHLEQEEEEAEQENVVPPYVKKYNRRNKQLMDLLEGTLPPPEHKKKKHEHRYHRRKNPHWLEEDLFEAQRPSGSRQFGGFGVAVTTEHPNALPGENEHIEPDSGFAIVITNQSLATNNHSPQLKISSRAGQFVYHTVTSGPPPASAAATSVKKKRLPFVAITDRRVGPPKSRRNNNVINNLNSNSEQNHLPLP